MTNLLLQTDFYKMVHHAAYPDKMQSMSSYFEARKGAKFDSTVFFGLQYILKKYLTTPITEADIQEAKEIAYNAFGTYDYFNEDGWYYILREHKGYIPVRIEAVPEGSVIPVSNVLMQLTATDPKCAWVVNYIEGLLTHVWFPTTVATLSYNVKQMLGKYLAETAESSDGLDYMLHDFAFRGVSSSESAEIGGLAHLVNFKGTDTIPAIPCGKKYYSASRDIGATVWASEHSLMTSEGKDGEASVVGKVLDRVKTGIVSIVADSYNYYNFVDNIIGKQYRFQIMARDGVTVVRPDCHDEHTEILTSSGCKYFKDLSYEDKVAQVDNNGNLSFVIPDRIISENYEGKMIKYLDTKGRLDALVTPNHRMAQIDLKRNIKIVEAENTFHYWGMNFFRAAKKETGVKNKLLPIERLKIAFQADGSFVRKSKKILTFNFQKQRKTDRLKEILDLCGVKYNLTYQKSRKGQSTFYINVSEQFSKLFDWVNLEEVTYNWAQEFIEELSYWDATRRTSTRYKYDTSVEYNANKVQEICAIAGYGASLSKYTDNRKVYFSDIYSLTILTHNNIIGGQAVIKETVDYSGKVYCVTVPSGMTLTRRNKKLLVSGNSVTKEHTTPESLVVWTLESLFNSFGGSYNSKGYKVLNPKIRIIWGDGIDIDGIEKICRAAKENMFSVENLVFGMGSGLLQKINRDTMRFAFKCSSMTVDGELREIYKNPLDSSKSSKRGILKLIRFTREDGSTKYMTVKANDPDYSDDKDILEVVFENGKLIKEYTFEEVRQNVNKEY